MNSARLAAAKTVFLVVEQGQSLDAALTKYEAFVANTDRALFRAIAYGGVRWYLAYFAYLVTQLRKPFKPKDRIINAIIITALYQLDDMEQAPHAVVNEAVALATKSRRKWACSTINAILRRYLRNPDERLDLNKTEWIRKSFPCWLIKHISSDWPDETDSILHASQLPPPMTLRVNLQDNSRTIYLNKLSKQNIAARECADSPLGITLEKPLPVEALVGFDKAWASVQDESAQLVVPLLDLSAGHHVLDACAAPGGKSLHIMEAEPGLGQLVALDLAPRLPRLCQNVSRAKAKIKIIEGDLLKAQNWWDKTPFDRILLDVPCTGTGVMRRHPDIKLRREPENVLQFAEHQLKLLNHAWRLLKPGGKLLYTTCSIMPEENDLCISRFITKTLDAQSLALPTTLGYHTPSGRQRLPGIHNGDGFFYALLIKVT